MYRKTDSVAGAYILVRLRYGPRPNFAFQTYMSSVLGAETVNDREEERDNFALVA